MNKFNSLLTQMANDSAKKNTGKELSELSKQEASKEVDRFFEDRYTQEQANPDAGNAYALWQESYLLRHPE